MVLRKGNLQKPNSHGRSLISDRSLHGKTLGKPPVSFVAERICTYSVHVRAASDVDGPVFRMQSR